MRVRRALRFDDFRAVSRLFEPEVVGLRKLLTDLEEHWTEASACALVGCSTLIWRDWKVGRFKPSGAARRAIWCAWCFSFHPDRLHQWQDWITWGRVRQRSVPPPGKFAEDYQI